MECSVCGGVACGMGALGRMGWFRCQDCGMEFGVDLSTLQDEEDDEEEEEGSSD